MHLNVLTFQEILARVSRKMSTVDGGVYEPAEGHPRRRTQRQPNVQLVRRPLGAVQLKQLMVNVGGFKSVKEIAFKVHAELQKLDSSGGG